MSTPSTPSRLPAAQQQEHKIEVSLSKLLTAGTTVAGLVMLAGIAWLVLRAPGDARPKYDHFVPTAQEGKGLGAVIQGVMSLEPHAIMLGGVMLLVLTPVARVLFTLLAFVLKKDWLYVAMTAVVLGVLAYGLLGGKVH